MRDVMPSSNATSDKFGAHGFLLYYGCIIAMQGPDLIDLTEDVQVSNSCGTPSQCDDMSKKQIMEMAARANAKTGRGLFQANLQPVNQTTTQGGSKRCRNHTGQPAPAADVLVIADDDDVEMLDQYQRPSKRQLLQHHVEELLGQHGGSELHAALRAQQHDASRSSHANGSAGSLHPPSQSQPQQDGTTVSNSELRQLAMEREQRERQRQQSQHGASSSAPASASHAAMPNGQTAAAGRPCTVSILTYNVWFKEEVALQERMQGVATVIEECGFPDFIMLQEVTPKMMDLWSSMPWWARYHVSVPPRQPYFTLICARKDTVSLSSGFSSVPYPHSQMARDLLYVHASVYGWPLLVGTTHLESPCPSADGNMQLFKEARIAQQKHAVSILHTKAPVGTEDIVLGGDFNWKDSRDGPLHLAPGWLDAWAAMRPEDRGLTYDAQSNPMLEGYYAGSRLDRMLCRLGSSFEAVSTELVGTQPIPGAKYWNKSTFQQMPVLPSDHYGVLLTMRLKHGLHPKAAPVPIQSPSSASGMEGVVLPFTGTGRVLGGM